MPTKFHYNLHQILFWYSCRTNSELWFWASLAITIPTLSQLKIMFGLFSVYLIIVSNISACGHYIKMLYLAFCHVNAVCPGLLLALYLVLFSSFRAFQCNYEFSDVYMSQTKFIIKITAGELPYYSDETQFKSRELEQCTPGGGDTVPSSTHFIENGFQNGIRWRSWTFCLLRKGNLCFILSKLEIKCQLGIIKASREYYFAECLWFHWNVPGASSVSPQTKKCLNSSYKIES